jgi:SanA protein
MFAIHFPNRRRSLRWFVEAKRFTKVLLKWGFGGMVGILLANAWVVFSTQEHIFYEVENLPSNDVGLVLGTSKRVFGGKENLFFKYRIEAAARLYHEGKVKYLILSGNHDSIYYNEPADMQKALVKLGVPPEALTLDYAGFRTLDSIRNCRDLFNQDQITVISQPFHNARALFLADHMGIHAVAFAAQDVPDGYSVKTLLREYLARPRAMVDVWLLDPIRHNQTFSD